VLSEHNSSGNKLYQQVTMTEADNYDNTGNPNITGHYLLLDDNLYHSINGRSWREANVSDFAFPESPDLVGLLKKIPVESYDNARWDFYAGYPCVILSFMDDEPLFMPSLNASGGINTHTFYFDLQGRCLRSYWVSTTPLMLGGDGELIYIAPPTTWYSVIDIDYQEFAIPTP